jgi:branched-chain amino acid transport system permease protein
VFQLASLTDVQWQMSGEVVLMTLLGGIHRVRAGRRRVHDHLARAFPRRPRSMVTMISGIFVVCVLAFRRGIVGELAAWWAKRRG